MLPIYATALAIGGTLLLASLVLGHHGADHPGDLGGAESGIDGHVDGDGTGGGFGLFAGVLSLRFWTFAAAFFGLTGVVFTTFALADGRVTLGLATGFGAGSGLLASWTVKKLRGSVVSSLPSEIGYVGLTGEMLLEARPDEPGRIRLTAKGSLVDLPARSSERLVRGARALVVDVSGGVATVAAAPPQEETQKKEGNA